MIIDSSGIFWIICEGSSSEEAFYFICGTLCLLANAVTLLLTGVLTGEEHLLKQLDFDNVGETGLSYDATSYYLDEGVSRPLLQSLFPLPFSFSPPSRLLSLFPCPFSCTVRSLRLRPSICLVHFIIFLVSSQALYLFRPFHPFYLFGLYSIISFVRFVSRPFSAPPSISFISAISSLVRFVSGPFRLWSVSPPPLHLSLVPRSFYLNACPSPSRILSHPKSYDLTVFFFPTHPTSFHLFLSFPLLPSTLFYYLSVLVHAFFILTVCLCIECFVLTQNLLFPTCLLPTSHACSDSLQVFL